MKAAQISRTRSIAFVGLSIALVSLSAWIAVPFGPIMLTLQTFALGFVLLVLPSRQAIAAVAGYILLGVIGLPVFSGGRGGFSMLLGPSGGYIWGYLLGAVVALLLLNVLRMRFKHAAAVDVMSALVFSAVYYVCAWLQFMVVMGVSPVASCLATVVPFIIPDVLKLVMSALCARRVREAIRIGV